jgi:hypothetical protein
MHPHHARFALARVVITLLKPMPAGMLAPSLLESA